MAQRQVAFKKDDWKTYGKCIEKANAAYGQFAGSETKFALKTLGVPADMYSMLTQEYMQEGDTFMTDCEA
jgi:hypothetical protein